MSRSNERVRPRPPTPANEAVLTAPLEPRLAQRVRAALATHGERLITVLHDIAVDLGVAPDTAMRVADGASRGIALLAPPRRRG